MSRFRVFETKTPDITASERTRNIKAKAIYKSMIKVANESCPDAAGRNYSGTMKFDISGNVTNYKSYELANTMGKGAALVWDNCCRGLAAFEYHPPYNGWDAWPIGRFQGMETWNTNGTLFRYNNLLPDCRNMGRPTCTLTSIYPKVWQYWGGTGTGWVVNELNNAGVTGIATGNQGSTLDGSGVWIDPSSNLFGTFHDCEIDKWKKGDRIHPKYRYVSGNNSKNNYLVAYQAMGRRYNLKKWNLRFTPIMYQLDCSGTIVWRGRPGDCCPPFLGLIGPTGPPLP